MADRIELSGNQYWDGTNKAPYSGAKMYTYIAGTTTNKTTWTTASEAVAHANPIIADSNGIFPEIYGTTNYDIVIKNSDDTVIIHQADGLTVASSSPVPSSVTIYTTAGTDTYTTPVNASALKVTCIGGGGGGAGGNNPSSWVAGGGGSGAMAITYITNPDSSYSYTVGAGGAGAAATVSGGATGGTTSFGSVCSAAGGVGGQDETGGLPGETATGDVTFEGFPGQNGALNNTGTTNHIGGSGGGRGARHNNVTPNAGTGAGGSGGDWISSTAQDGEDGASGSIIIEEYT